ncbi:hypothetical protein BCR32DRAFT_293284 [Anaeromyces robustus]|uniref:Coth-domain-containing protein n=1 Tax=Anaeromyces robustus TaxID=1754192 RepID=A0A1Y1X6L9_9FUNG|nr:hypothetical protein BCR32DRAFT_293284 [Anaeromyces robustus]|eukprot:ORX81429.1 hypothetical protein BCR32DRAFT_293284 [Anaeromyces robustus]
MKFHSALLLLSTRALITNAELVTFKVLAVNGIPTLNINNEHHKMEAVPDNYPLYKISVNVDNFPVNYNYILNDGEKDKEEKEEFTRQRTKDEYALNEFFGRSVTIKEHPLLPKAYESFKYATQSKLFNDNYVATIVIKCDPEKLKSIHTDVKSKEKIDAEVIYANPYTIKTFKNAKLSLSGQSTVEVPKLSYKIKKLKDDKNKELFGRSSIKLRAEHMDPSMLREKIYTDVLNTLGVPTPQNTFARLFINGEPIGLFDLSDDVKNSRYLRETFNQGEKYKDNTLNPLFKGSRISSEGLYSNLGYYGEDVNQPVYSWVYDYKGEDKVLNKTQHIEKELIPFLKEIDDYKTHKSDNMPLEIDTFLRSLAMEFLGGGVDNYWANPGNFFVYKDAEKNQWFFQDCDFHYTFGVKWAEKQMLMTPLSKFPPSILEDDKDDKTRPPLDAILEHQEHKDKLNKIFERILKTSYHQNALFPRLESLTNLIREDAHWDVTLTRTNVNPTHGLQNVYTIDDFENEATSEKPDGFSGGYTLRYFIKTKATLLAEELNLTIPVDYESNLGYYENLSFNEDEDSDRSGSLKTISINIFTVLICYLVSILF